MVKTLATKKRGGAGSRSEQAAMRPRRFDASKIPRRICHVLSAIKNHPLYSELSQTTKQNVEDPDNPIFLKYISPRERNAHFRDIWRHLYLKEELVNEHVHDTPAQKAQRRRELREKFGFIVE